MENLPDIEKLKQEQGYDKMAKVVLGWGKRVLEENEKLKSEVERLKEEKFDWYEEEYLKPIPENTPEQQKIKILTWRLWKAKEANKSLRQSSDATIENLNKSIKEWREKYHQAITFEYDGTSFEGLITFAHNVRNYLLSGLRHMKSCAKCLEKTCPDDIKYKKDKDGKFIKEIEKLGNDTYIWTGYEEYPSEEYLKNWGICIGKMIKALELKEKYDRTGNVVTEKDKQLINEGIELLIRYQDSFFY
jgi:hypothetical protein